MYLSVLFANAVIDFPDGRVWLWSGAAHHRPNLIQAEEEGFPGFPGGSKVYGFVSHLATWLFSATLAAPPPAFGFVNMAALSATYVNHL